MVLHPRPNSAADLALPCGKCLGCKTARAQEWALRCVHEARLHEHSIFATLTYAPKHLPANGALLPRDLALFLKRLRQAMARRRNHPPALPYGKLRYLAAGEYGDKGGRPHYHAILFGVSLADARFIGTSKSGNPLYRSETLDKLWRYGTVDFGEVTAASAAYTASYTMKSFTSGDFIDDDAVIVQPPFLRQSLKPGIGATHVDRFSGDLRAGAVRHDGTARRTPRYYKKRLEENHPEIAEEAEYNSHLQRVDRAARDPASLHPDRLVAEEIIAHRRKSLSDTHSL